MMGGGLLGTDKYHTSKLCQADIFRLRIAPNDASVQSFRNGGVSLFALPVSTRILSQRPISFAESRSLRHPNHIDDQGLGSWMA
jgi:hypothetical protein